MSASRSKSRLLLFVYLAVVFGLTQQALSHGSAWKLLFRPPEPAMTSVFDYRVEVPSTHANIADAKGENASPDADGNLILDAEKGAWVGCLIRSPRGGFTNAHVCAWLDGRGEAVLELEDIGEKTVTLSNLSILRHRSFDLTPHIEAGHTYLLKFRVHGGAAGARGVLTELSVRRNEDFPRFPPLHTAAWVTMGLFIAWMMNSRKPWRKRHVAFAVGLAAFAVRWQTMGALYGVPLEGDAPGYQSLAADLSWRHPFNTGVREQLFVWMDYITRHLFGTADVYIRLLTLVLSVGIVVGTYLLAERLLKSRFAAIVAAALLAFGNFAVYNATRGERSELFVFVLLFYFLFLLAKPRGLWHEILIGVMGAAVGLTWLMGLPTVFLSYIYRWRHFRLNIGRVLVFAATVGLLMAPHFLDQSARSGDPLKALNVHVNFYKNAREAGVPSYEGGNRSWASYLVGDQGLYKVAVQGVRGYLELLLNPTNPCNKIFLGFHYAEVYSYFLFPFYLAGMVWLVIKRQWAPLLLLICTLHISVSFLGEIRDPRLFLQAAPFFGIFFGWGVSQARFALRNKLEPATAPKPAHRRKKASKTGD